MQLVGKNVELFRQLPDLILAACGQAAREIAIRDIAKSENRGAQRSESLLFDLSRAKLGDGFVPGLTSMVYGLDSGYLADRAIRDGNACLILDALDEALMSSEALESLFLDDNLHFACTGTWPEWVHGSADVNDAQWHHVAGVYDGEELRLYVDGQLDASVGTSGLINVNEHPVYIGENAEHPGREWNGLIDDVRLYNYALSETEIQTLHDAGS